MTGPGHSSISTGSTPKTHGIVGNNWYDRERKHSIYCTDDSNYNNVGGDDYSGNKSVLKGISCEFEKGKTSLIIGQTGSGKTVFLKCLLGLHKYDRGEVLFDKINLNSMTELEKMSLKSNIGTVFQGSALFDSMNIEENVMFPLKMFKNIPSDEMHDRVNSVLKRVELENSNKKMPSEASGGMQKRVAIARAIVNEPKYLFCDEPNSGLDPKTAIVIDNLIKEITEELNITTIINSHDMNSGLKFIL